MAHAYEHLAESAFHFAMSFAVGNSIQEQAQTKIWPAEGGSGFWGSFCWGWRNRRCRGIGRHSHRLWGGKQAAD